LAAVLHYLLRRSVPGPLGTSGLPFFSRARVQGWVESMPQASHLAVPSQGASALRGLAELFPNASPLRMPITVRATRGDGHRLEDHTVIEFGTSMIVFFDSRLPLELANKIQLENFDGSLRAEAVVVAVRDGAGRRAIAARFVAEVRNWIIQG